MTLATRQEVLSLYRRILRIARSWQTHCTRPHDTEIEKNYIVQESRTLFRKNKQLTDAESIRKCIEECQARIEIGLHYRNPYPRPIHIPPMGLASQRGRHLRTQERLRKQAKPVYLKSHDET
ncbi:LYR motif containing protein 1 [Paramormyrops kingsleyae]|uniref:LYR motif containing protein 1 n=1 Tax=Paramormyrops kingsleyae TaxID=1676925 RepID=UPI000CD61733|nr:LYR motif-containing protein 1 [Paramormyrops kingsleyae]